MEALIQALKDSGTSERKLVHVREVLKSNPKGNPELIVRDLKDKFRDFGKGTPHGEGYGEETVNKVQALLTGSYRPPIGPETPAHKPLTHGELQDQLGGMLVEFRRSVQASVRDALSELAANAVQGEPIQATAIQDAVKATIQELTEASIARIEQTAAMALRATGEKSSPDAQPKAVAKTHK